jgi:hypothetical protein
MGVWNLVHKEKHKNTETFIDTSKEVGLEVNTEKTKYMWRALVNSVMNSRFHKMLGSS